MKIVTNRCWGGFGLSNRAIAEYYKHKDIVLYWYHEDWRLGYKIPDEEKYTLITEEEAVAQREMDSQATTIPLSKSHDINQGFVSCYDIGRDDPILVAVVEDLGSEAASGEHAKLEVVEIPDGVKWQIEEYDGLEWIAEEHRTW